jgi:hypothetical protein
MKRSIELDTDEISDGLTKVRSRLHIARLACEGSRVTTEAASSSPA